ncbi:sperm surface protein Sp17 [Protopterus annectens]|uniref:sperm surface protein Sp17 n=1 Tax=Protopterus annectens TaxID=7888 RepID=UPI001CFB1C44|nr:sperm surface protein Sp17 [Protopterus annectens]
MSVPFSNTSLRIPHGFGNLLEGLAREVLREQPDDIPLFAARYFSHLLQQREESGIDPAEWGAKLEDRFYNNHIFKQSSLSDFEEPNTEEEAAIKIQATYRGYATRQEVKKLKANKDMLPTSPVNLTFAEQPALSSMEDILSYGNETPRLKEEEKVDIWKRPSTSALSEQSQENSPGSYTLRQDQDFDKNNDSIVDGVVADPETKAEVLETEHPGTVNVDTNAMELPQQDMHETAYSATTDVDISATQIAQESISEMKLSQNGAVITQEDIQKNMVTSNADIPSTERTEESVQDSQTNAALIESSAIEVTQEHTSESDCNEASVDVSTDEEPKITTPEATVMAVGTNAGISSTERKEESVQDSQTNAALIESSAIEVTQEHTSESDCNEASVDVSTDEEPKITTPEATVMAVGMNADISSTERKEESVQDSQTNAALIESSAIEVTQEHTSESDHIETSVDVSTDEEPKITTLEATFMALEMKTSSTYTTDMDKEFEQNKGQEIQERAEGDESSQVNARSVDPESVKESGITADDKMVISEEGEDIYNAIHNEPYKETEVESGKIEAQEVKKETTETEGHTATTEESLTTDLLENLESNQAVIVLLKGEPEEKQEEQESARETVSEKDA